MTKFSLSVFSAPKLIFFFAAFLLTWGCQTLSTLDDVTGGWTLDTTEKEKPTIYFEEQGQKVNGYDGCNRYFGTYSRVGIKGISITVLGSTKMYCHNSASSDEFVSFLSKVSHAEIKGNTLLLIDEPSATSQTFIRQ